MSDAVHARPAITGSTRLVGLLGWPVEHSFSPAMHNAAFAACGLDWCYVPLPVPPARLGDALAGLPALGFRGVNVTVPHKQNVVPHLDAVTDDARRIGAVNTIVVDEFGSLRGHNTDAPGLVRDLREHDVDPSGANVVVLGAGGAARAATVACMRAGAASIAVANRTLERAKRLVQTLRVHESDGSTPSSSTTTGTRPAAARAPLDDMDTSLAPTSELRAVRWSDRGEVIAAADLVLQCTPLGLPPNDEASPLPASNVLRTDQVAYDLVYGRWTPFLETASAAGTRAIDGSGMLVWQGALAFQLWTGRRAPVETMRAALPTGGQP